MRCCLPMLSLVWACGPPPRPSVLLITVDTTRADHLSPYGAKEARTPTYDQLAAEGTTYLRAYSTAPLTIVSHATIMTGRAPPAHGVRDNGDFLLGQDQVTLAERFHAAGYTTAAFTGAFPTQARWGFGQGFDVYHDPLEGLPTELDWSDQRRADQVVSDAIQTLTDLHTDAPLFVWVHLFDAHWPYAPPEPYRSWFPKAPYDGEIAFASAQVGRFLRWWDEARPDSAMVLTADHGEGLGDGGEKTHGFLLHDATIHVPLFLRGHGALAAAVPAGARVDDVVSHIDIAPTLLDLAGVPLGPELQGRDLRQGGSGVAYSEAMTPQYNLGLAPLYAITDQNGRYTEGAWGAYYPIKGDRIDTNPEVPADLVGGAHRLAALRARLGTTKSTEAALDPKALAQLQALGYLGGDVHAAAGTIDPRDVIDVIPLTWLVKEAMGHKKPDEVESMLRTLEARLPGSWGVDLLRAQQLRAQGRLDDAVERLTTLYQRSPSATVALQIADLWRAQDDPDEARAWYAEALDGQPASPEAMLGLVLCTEWQGDTAEAEALSERFLALYPDHAQLGLIHAELLLADGQIDDAADEADWALNDMPEDPWAWMVASNAHWARGDADKAIDLLAEALERDPSDLGVRMTLVDHLQEVGRIAEARRDLAPAWRWMPDDPEVAQRAEALGMADAEQEDR